MDSNKFYKITIAILLLLVIWISWRLEHIKGRYSDESDMLRKSIIAADSLVKEADGRYAKLVNYYNSEKDLKKQLKESNDNLYKIIKKQNERILSLTNTVITLQGKIDSGQGTIDPTDTSKILLSLNYPEKNDPFINWSGMVDRVTAKYNGEWKFGSLPIQIVVTEDTRGLWKHRIVGPEWLIIDSLSVNSLPPDEYTSTVDRKLQFMVGGGYSRTISNPNWGTINFGVGLSIVNKHNIIVNVNTRQELGVNYYYKFKAVKDRK